MSQDNRYNDYENGKLDGYNEGVADGKLKWDEMWDDGYAAGREAAIMEQAETAEKIEQEKLVRRNERALMELHNRMADVEYKLRKLADKPNKWTSKWNWVTD